MYDFERLKESVSSLCPGTYEDNDGNIIYINEDGDVSAYHYEGDIVTFLSYNGQIMSWMKCREIGG